MGKSNAYLQVTTLTVAQVEELCRLYHAQWWTGERTVDGVRRMLEGSDAVIGLTDAKTDKLVAFCRVLSDGVYRAVVYDVIVADSHQSRGLGRTLMDAVMGHPVVAHVARVELFCLPDMVSFYEKWGFSTTPSDWRTMTRPDDG